MASYNYKKYRKANLGNKLRFFLSDDSLQGFPIFRRFCVERPELVASFALLGFTVVAMAIIFPMKLREGPRQYHQRYKNYYTIVRDTDVEDPSKPWYN
ncbi:hypothetical protein ACJMK2_034999 [Sinanodonta woodiana]|uniref:Uncharacterized protein n=1 Tax=Sinanodonta woodiana TaxID=1069815 RepID=A0ABD3WWY9_SINWO